MFGFEKFNKIKNFLQCDIWQGFYMLMDGLCYCHNYLC